MKPARLLSMFAIAALAFALPFTAGASVKKDGAWPVVEKRVDLEFDGKPSDGLQALAKKAGWSLVVSRGVAMDRGDVHVDVEDQPADAVLEALFLDQDVVAYRNGALVTVTPRTTAEQGHAASSAPAAAVPAEVAAPSSPAPVPTIRGEDRDVIGGSLVIHAGEVVHSVTVAGGSLKVEGTVTGDLVVAGGSAKVVAGGHVVGDATVIGGSLKIEKDGRVDGDVGVAGGSLVRADGAIIGGRVVDDDHHGEGKSHAGEDGSGPKASADSSAPGGSRLSQAAHQFGQSVTKMALLFVLGCVLLALLAPRMERLRVEIASRPMRSFALGLVGAVVGSIGALVLVTILCITIIGIPVAIAGILFAILALYGAIASVLTTLGAAVVGHRTDNPYLHLLLGCAAFLVLSSIPWIGGLVTFAVAMVALGALVATRAGGLLARRRPPPAGPV